MRIILFTMFFVGAKSEMYSMAHSTFFPPSPIFSFGFEEGGRFSIDYNPVGNQTVYIAVSPNTIDLWKLLELCGEKDIGIHPGVQKFKTNVKDRFDGIVYSKGVYNMYVFNCDKNMSSFHINMNLTNPNTHLDYRNEALPSLYRTLAWMYFCIFVLWLSHAQYYQIFKIPLHLTFMLLPLLKMVCLGMHSYGWSMIKMKGSIHCKASIVMHIFDVLYYSTLLSSLSYVCSGCNIFRKSYTMREHFEIIMSSFLLTIGMIGISNVESEVGLFLWIIVGAIGWLWYLNLDIVGIVITTKLLERVKSRENLFKHISNARLLIIRLYIIVSIAFISNTGLFLSNLPSIVSVIALEFGILFSTLCQMRFFLYKSEPIPYETGTLPSLPIRPKFLVEPNKKSLVILYRE